MRETYPITNGPNHQEATMTSTTITAPHVSNRLGATDALRELTLEIPQALNAANRASNLGRPSPRIGVDA
jgi:hypothetical protein